jgi:hypothetical protein
MMSDFKELLSEFNAHSVEFLIVGAHGPADFEGEPVDVGAELR